GPATLLVGAGVLLAVQFAPAIAPTAAAPKPPRPAPADRFLQAGPRSTLPGAGADEVDEVAALEAIRIALTEVEDGSAYVWHRRKGRLSGLVQPTTSFKDPAGCVCRHILVLMVRGDRMGRVESTACRLDDGRWDLET